VCARGCAEGRRISVLSAGSAEQALQLLRDDSATAGLRVILTDHVLPGASGDAFVRELREFSPSVPVLVITGMDEAEQAYAGLEITFLHKPCAPEDLIAQVRASIKKQVVSD